MEIAAAAGCLKDRTTTTVAKCALDVTQVDGNYVDEPCVVDRNLVSARTWHDNTPFMREFLKLLRNATPATETVES